MKKIIPVFDEVSAIQTKEYNGRFKHFRLSFKIFKNIHIRNTRTQPKPQFQHHHQSNQPKAQAISDRNRNVYFIVNRPKVTV